MSDDQDWVWWNAAYWNAEAAAATARAERAEAAIQRIRELAYTFQAGWNIRESILAALDSTDPVEAAPEPGPIERDREIARAEVELVQRWWVRDAEGYRYRMAGPQAAAEVAAMDTWGRIPGPFTVEYSFEARPVHSRYFKAPPFPGGQPDAQAPL